MSERKYVCWYGNRHPVSVTCECPKKYKKSPAMFRDHMRACGIQYPNDIDDSSRIRILEYNPLK